MVNQSEKLIHLQQSALLLYLVHNLDINITEGHIVPRYKYVIYNVYSISHTASFFKTEFHFPIIMVIMFVFRSIRNLILK